MFFTPHKIDRLSQCVLETIYKYSFVTIKQLINFHNTSSLTKIKNALEKLYKLNLIKKFEYNSMFYYTPVNVIVYEQYFTSEEFLEHEKSLDMFSYLYKMNVKKNQNTLTNIVEHQPVLNAFPITISFVVETKDLKTSDNKYQYYDIMYISEGNEGNANFLAKRIDIGDEEGTCRIVIVENKNQLPLIKIDGVIAFYKVNHYSGQINILE